ncbi:hypothetical protein, partial [Xenorhabdus thuongxuanensis]|uniref:hypothetical protein n=1 Tax=Xenorhabdus thuongxuanensis TaxID=1873484 RepID=UPI0039EED966
GGKISINKQPFQLWTNGSFIPLGSERQQEARREALRQRIKKIGEMRKNNDELQRHITTCND